MSIHYLSHLLPTIELRRSFAPGSTRVVPRLTFINLPPGIAAKRLWFTRCEPGVSEFIFRSYVNPNASRELLGAIHQLNLE